MRAYCDTSVLADLLLDPRSSWQARAMLDSWRERGSLITSRLTVVELGRLMMRKGSLTTTASLNSAALPIEYVSLGDAVLRNAASLPVRYLKSLDALHLASAVLTRCDVVLTRDRQMQRACEELGLAVA